MKLSISQPFQDFLASIGLDFPLLLEKAGLPNKIWQEEIELSNLDYQKLMLTFDEVLSDDIIASLSQVENITQFQPAFFAALSSPNGLTAIQRFAQFKPLVGPISLKVMESEDYLDISFTYTVPEMALPRFIVLNEQLLLLSLIRTGTGKDIKPVEVASAFDYKNLSKIFGCETKTSEENHIVFAKSDLALPFLTQNNVMWSYLEPGLREKLAANQGPKTLSEVLGQELLKHLAGGQSSIDDMAGRLGLSSRSLQRKLKEEGTSFKEVLQKAQLTMTETYLKQDLPTEEIAFLVGYTETSSFLRAFKKWTGLSLSNYKLNVK